MKMIRLHGLPKAVVISLIVHSAVVISTYVIVEGKHGVVPVTIPVDLVVSLQTIGPSGATVTGTKDVSILTPDETSSPFLPVRREEFTSTSGKPNFRTEMAENWPETNMSSISPPAKSHISGKLLEAAMISDAPLPPPLPVVKPRLNVPVPGEAIAKAKPNFPQFLSVQTPSLGKSKTVVQKQMRIPHLKKDGEINIQSERMLTAVAGGKVITPMPGNLPPSYPEQGRKKGYEGQVLLTVQVSTTGHVVDIVIASSSGFSLLDNAAIAAVRHWRFRSISKVKEPINSAIQIPITFRLSDTLSLRK